MVKVLGWYDNEWGYSNRLVDLVEFVGDSDARCRDRDPAVPQLEDLPLRTGTRVLLRADFNVPLRDGAIDDDLRITAALPTIAVAARARRASIVLCSHLGRPEGQGRPAVLAGARSRARLGELLGTRGRRCRPRSSGFDVGRASPRASSRAT